MSTRGMKVSELVSSLQGWDPDSIVYVLDGSRLGFSGYPDGYDYLVLGDSLGVPQPPEVTGVGAVYYDEVDEEWKGTDVDVEHINDPEET